MSNSSRTRDRLRRGRSLPGVLALIGVGAILVVVISQSPGDDASPPTGSSARPEAPEATRTDRESDACRALWEAEVADTSRRTREGGLAFAGYDWNIRDYDGGPTTVGTWSADQVSLEDDGLRLLLSETEGGWRSAEVYTRQEGFGYGTYRWRIESDLTELAPSIVLGLFTYEAGAPGNREIDIEVTRWADPRGPNLHVTRHQEDGFDGRSAELSTSAATEHAFRWMPGEITWCSRDATGRDLFATTLPTELEPGKERVHMNLWIYGGEAPATGTSVLVADFTFTPA